MSAEQKIIAINIHAGMHAQALEETLNTLAAEGWRVQQVSTVVTRKGGAIHALKNAYYADTYYLVLEKSPSRQSYRCLLQQREKRTEGDVEVLNCIIDDQHRDGYRLAHLLHAASISVNEERPTPGTIAHVLLFEKEN